MKRVVVTMAGRRRYLELLHAHLAAQRDAFDEWHLWVNTRDQDDIRYMMDLAAREPEWITTVVIDAPCGTNNSVHRFYPIDAVDPETTYLKLDDDIVYLAPDFVKTMCDTRERLDHPFLVYGNILNNALTTFKHQQLGRFQYARQCTYSCSCDVGWHDAKCALALHHAFLACPHPETWALSDWTLGAYERCSINAIAWRGVDFAAFGGRVGFDDEQWLSVDFPKHVGRPNVVVGTAFCVHFAFYTQRGGSRAVEAMLPGYQALVPGR